MKRLNVIRILLCCSILLCLISRAQAQSDPLVQARVFVDMKDYSKAIEIYKKLYDQSPTDGDVYSGYLDALIGAKEYKDAEKLVNNQLSMSQHNPLLLIDLGKVYLASGKEKKANEPFENAIALLNGDDILTTRMANSFTALGQDKYAIKVYERAIEILRNTYLYSLPLARLYSKTGDIEKAINALLNMGPMQMPGMEDPKGTMLELLGIDPKKVQLAQKALINRINEQPENTWYADLLTWLYTQKDDWDGALMQIEALDARLKENGQRLLEFARYAKTEKQYPTAIKALEGVIEKGKDQPMYAIAKAEKLNVLMQQLQDDPFFKPEDVTAMEKEYSSFLTEFPQYYSTETLRDYAALEAQYADKPQLAIELLQKGIDAPSPRRDFSGWAKLQMGDYDILVGKLWEASLLYSQVDKAFREDLLGEEARFRNAKLSYYQGDFEWAQGQLSVLKASTSELIANDALYLSVLITENIPPDSNLVPLKRFAYADLLLFQNKDKEAEALLDSLSTTFPQHPLKDDILMLRSKLAIKRHDFTQALEYMKLVYDPCKDCKQDDLLKDDALFRTAEVYDKYMKQPDQAKKFYERLIVDYPGSTYVQTARVKLKELTEGTAVLP
jgi:tetratricopeptide (TPR) repeat protein